MYVLKLERSWTTHARAHTDFDSYKVTLQGKYVLNFDVANGFTF